MSDTVISCAVYTQGHKVADIPVEQISDALKQEDTFVWLGLHEPDKALMQKVQEEFNLHELAVEDAQNAHQRPKIEEYGDSIFIVLHTVELKGQHVHIGETHVFLGSRYLISVRHGSSIGYAPVRARCEHMPQRLSKGPSFALYALMDFIVDQYVPIVNAFESRFEELEDDVLKGRSYRRTIRRLYALKRQLITLRGSALPAVDICNQLMRLHPDLIPKDIRVYFRDIHDHILRIEKTTDAVREMLTAALQVSLSIVTIGQNEIVKRLAGWGAILAVPTMVFSIYGMNFKFMPELSWKWGYPSALVLVVMICAWLYRRLKRVKWL